MNISAITTAARATSLLPTTRSIGFYNAIVSLAITTLSLMAVAVRKHRHQPKQVAIDPNKWRVIRPPEQNKAMQCITISKNYQKTLRPVKKGPVEKMQRLEAYSFNTKLDLDTMRSILSRKTGLSWKKRYGENHDYIRVIDKRTGTAIRIFEEEQGQYKLDMLNENCSRKDYMTEQKGLMHILFELGTRLFTAATDNY